MTLEVVIDPRYITDPVSGEFWDACRSLMELRLESVTGKEVIVDGLGTPISTEHLDNKLL
jgi:hypothetical protein